MTVTLKIEVTSPLTADDRDLLAGIAVMTIAIANREINQNAAQQMVEDAGPDRDHRLDPSICGEFEYIQDATGPAEATGAVCVSQTGHRGRHRYRQPEEVPVMVN